MLQIDTDVTLIAGAVDDLVRSPLSIFQYHIPPSRIERWWRPRVWSSSLTNNSIIMQVNEICRSEFALATRTRSSHLNYEYVRIMKFWWHRGCNPSHINWRWHFIMDLLSKIRKKSCRRRFIDRDLIGCVGRTLTCASTMDWLYLYLFIEVTGVTDRSSDVV